ncbi:unnamed protein product [Urochloa humidicola]
MSPPHESARAPPARPNRGHQPSFSAALLDAIYHSLEADADADARSSTETRPTPASPPQRTPVSSRHHRAASATVSSPSRPSVRSPRLQRPPRPCRVRPDPQPNSLLLPPPPLPPPHEPARVSSADQKKKRSRKSKKKTKVAPFACLLNALLCNRRPARPADGPTTPRATAAFAAEPASARSILSSRASRRESAAAAGGVMTPARRAVRFSPVAVVVGGDERGGGVQTGTATRLRDAADAEVEAVAQAKESTAEAERRVEELLRALGVAEERERAKESSESSSDLFELESLPAFEDAEPPRPRASAGVALLTRPRPRVV